jgi:hypothetical protein
MSFLGVNSFRCLKQDQFLEVGLGESCGIEKEGEGYCIEGAT